MFQLHVFVNRVEHLVEFEAVNLDVFTETFNMNFYFNYLTRWPECCAVARRKSVQNKLKQGATVEASAGLVADVCAEVAEADGHIAGYIIGKVEGAGPKQLGISEAKAFTKSVTMSIYKRIYTYDMSIYSSSEALNFTFVETLGCCIFISLHALLQQRHAVTHALISDFLLSIL